MKRSSWGKDNGLCSTCSRSGACTFQQASKAPVLQCPEYAAPVPPSGASTAPGKTDSRSGERGLCSDCELRHECTRPRPESGVWRCEHYR